MTCAKIGSTVSQPGCFIVLGSSLHPLFGEVKDIVVLVDRCYFVVQMHETNFFLSHYHAYDISSLESYRICSLSDFINHRLSSYTIPTNKTVVSLKYHILESF